MSRKSIQGFIFTAASMGMVLCTGIFFGIKERFDVHSPLHMTVLAGGLLAGLALAYIAGGLTASGVEEEFLLKAAEKKRRESALLN